MSDDALIVDEPVEELPNGKVPKKNIGTPSTFMTEIDNPDFPTVEIGGSPA